MLIGLCVRKTLSFVLGPKLFCEEGREGGERSVGKLNWDQDLTFLKGE